MALITKATHHRLGFLVLLWTAMIGCKEDDVPSCVQCTSDLTVPFQLCKEGNGNASVDGTDTMVNYDVYLSNLEATGARCNR